LTRPKLLLVLLLAALAAVAVAACGDDDEDGEETQEFASITSLSSDSCDDVEYGGEGEPNALIASDLPLQGDSAERSEQMNAAIRQVLDREKWRAGNTRVAFQVCDDSIEETGEWDEAQCRENANAYADNPDVIGVIGTYNSGCAAEIIPILNEAPGGGVAMVSPGNTLPCLTESAKVCEADQPDGLYPSGERNYARVVPNDAAQGAGLALFAQDQGIKRAFVLSTADDQTSLGLAQAFRGAAEALGLDVVGFESWDPETDDYSALMSQARDANADAIVLAGLLEHNGAEIINDKVEELGPNEGPVQLLAPDGFAQQATIDDAGEAAKGMFVSVPGRTPDSLTGPGKVFVDELKSELGETPVELFAPYAGQAAEVLLSAIAPSPERAEIIEGLLQAEVDKGIVGTFAITPTGDPSVGPISVSVARDTFELSGEIVPPADLVDAARGG
jgi:branched-chain amino acid transport system substrate-binding protein